MSRLNVSSPKNAKASTQQLLLDFSRRISANPPGVCPIELQLAFLKVCHAQSCGKCVPCRAGLGQLENMITDVLDNKADGNSINRIRSTAENIMNSADCAIGFEAARLVLNGLDAYEEDYQSHVHDHRCLSDFEQPIPCITLCPAHVDIPGYIALAAAGRCDDALKLIRKDNPFPTACALICEHPCEGRCRRKMIDDAINIRGLKRFVVDNAASDTVPTPTPCAPTGKRVAVIGSGPSGLTAAYFLQLMGHRCTVFEEKKQLGGMMRYGIPNYRFPRERLRQDLDAIISTGIDIRTETRIGKDELVKLREEYDAVYIAIGAHIGKMAGIPGEESGNVFSAVEMLKEIGDGEYPDYTGKRVVVIGGGNVAMDCARTALRCHAKSVSIVYRRRQEDMTALPDEIYAAVAEGVELVTLMSPTKIVADENGNARALVVKPQMVGSVKNGRPTSRDAHKDAAEIPCDVVLIAVGQDINSAPFAEAGVSVKRGRITAKETGALSLPGVFAGGECVSGPATVIRAIEMGKVAAANIDEYLGFQHPITCDVDIPEPLLNDKNPSGRINLKETEAWERKSTFAGTELPMSTEEAKQEASRCLRCDRHGCSTLRGGRTEKW